MLILLLTQGKSAGDHRTFKHLGRAGSKGEGSIFFGVQIKLEPLLLAHQKLKKKFKKSSNITKTGLQHPIFFFYVVLLLLEFQDDL